MKHFSIAVLSLSFLVATGCGLKMKRGDSIKECRLLVGTGGRAEPISLPIVPDARPSLDNEGIRCTEEEIFGVKKLRDFAGSQEEWFFSLFAEKNIQGEVVAEYRLFPNKEGHKSKRAIQKIVRYKGTPCEYLRHNSFKFENIYLKDVAKGSLKFSCR